MKQLLVIGVVVLTWLAAHAPAAEPAADSNAELLKRSIRNPVIACPLAESPPTIDGHVNDQEWATASLVSDLLYTLEYNDKRWGLPTQHRARYWIQYTPDALYVAARFDLPAYAPRPRTDAQIHDRVASDDVLDVMFNPTGSDEWHVAGNATGMKMDRNFGRPNISYHWTPKTEYKARVLEGGGWEGEYRIPFADMERSTPAAGEKWRAAFVSVRKTPHGSVASWSYWKQWRPVNRNDSDGWIVFTGEPAGVQFKSGADQIGQRAIELAVVGKPSAPVKIDAHLFRRAGQPKPTEPGLIANLADWIDKLKIGGSDFFGMSYEQVVTQAMKELSPADTPQVSDGVVKTKPTELGEYLLTYQITRGEGDSQLILAAGALPFRVEPPVSLIVNPLVLVTGIYQVDTDLSGIDLDKAKMLELSVTTADGKVVGQKSQDVRATLERLTIAAAEWPAGEYTFTSRILDAGGQELGNTSEKIEKAAPPVWWTNREGMEPEVPAPWTPVEVQQADGKATVKVWGRTYEFMGLPVPVSVLATRDRLSEAEPEQLPQQLLAGPMELNAHPAGGSAPALWKNVRFEIVEQTASKVVIESENLSPTAGLTLKGKTTVEFDGMIRVDLELAGADGKPASVDRFDFVLPFRPHIAQLLSNYARAPGPGTTTGRFLGEVPRETWKYPIFYTQFIGNTEVGLEWFCDNTKGWRLKKPQEATEVERGDDRTTETFHLIDHPTTIDPAKPVAITFGMIATPTKPSRKGWEIYRMDQSASFPPRIGDMVGDTGKPATQQDVDEWVRRQAYSELKINLAFDTTWSGREWLIYPVDLTTDHGLKMKYRFDAAHQAGQKVCPHGGWFSMSASLPEYKYWGYEMVKEPVEGTLGQGSYACYNSPYTDFMVYNFAENARRVGIDGMRFDTTMPQTECQSFHHGCGWVGEDGKTYGSANLFASREYFKRLYRVFHGGVREEGIIYQPMGGPPINAVESFADIHEIGESNFQDAKTLKKGYPQADVRVRMTGAAYGLVTANNLKGHPLVVNNRVAALVVAGADPRMTHAGVPSISMRGYQNVWQRFPNVVELWNAWKWIDRGRSALWKPYWGNADTVRVMPLKTADIPSPEIYASYYYQPGKKVLLLVANYEDIPLQDLAVALDLQKLGFGGEQKLYGEDAITQEPVDVENGTLKLWMFPQRYRAVKISTEPPRFADAVLGQNLLPCGDFEAWPLHGATVMQPQGQPDPYANQDTSVARSGSASLRVAMSEDGKTTGMISLPQVALAPGKYLLSGYIKIDEDFPSEYPGGATMRIGMEAHAIITDPPREFSNMGGTFPIGERTPGWLRFLIPFEATAETKQISVRIDQTSAGTAWLDDVQIQSMTNP